MIKPEMFDDPDLGAVCPLARWLFAGLLTQADKRGRLKDEPARLKLRLLGFDPKADCDRLLDELHAARMVLRYEHEGTAYLWVRSFEKHQRPHPNEPESQIPACSDELVKKHFLSRKNTARNVLQRFGVRNLDLNSGSLDSGVLDHSSPDGDGFAGFWEAYPRKVGKGSARKAYEALGANAELQARIIDAIARQRQSRQWTKDGGQFIPHPTTWLRQGRWDDEPEPDVPVVNPRAAPVYAESWCQHDPRCASPDVHALVLAREQEASDVAC